MSQQEVVVQFFFFSGSTEDADSAQVTECIAFAKFLFFFYFFGGAKMQRMLQQTRKHSATDAKHFEPNRQFDLGVRHWSLSSQGWREGEGQGIPT